MEAMQQLDGWLAPISETTPAGVDVRLDMDHERLRDEIAKLSAVQGSTPDWALIETTGSALIQARSKDLLIAVYVACSLSVQRGVVGSALGCALVAGLLSRFGPLAFPLRPRARANALEWYLEWLSGYLDTATAQAQSEVDELRAHLGELRDAATELLGPEGPSFAHIFKSCERLGLKIPAPAENRNAEGEKIERAPVAHDGGADVKRSEMTAPASPRIAPRQTTESNESPAAPVAGNFRSAAQPVAPSAPPSSDGTTRYAFGPPPQDAQPMLSYVMRAGAVLIDLAASRFEAEKADARPYRWLRTGLWLRWEQVPGANRRGRTDIEGPSTQRRSALAKAVQAEQWDEVLTLSEQLLARNPFWLDLNHSSALALEKLGERFAAARVSVERESRALLRRLPELATLSFSDGTPFGTPATLSWLAPASAESQAIGPREGVVPKPLQERLEKGEPAAYAELEGLLRTSRSQRASFQLRLELGRALERAGQSRSAAQVYFGLERDIDDYRLERWEPELAVQVLQPLWKILLAHPERGGVHPEAARICARLAQLSPTALLEQRETAPPSARGER